MWHTNTCDLVWFLVSHNLLKLSLDHYFCIIYYDIRLGQVSFAWSKAKKTCFYQGLDVKSYTFISWFGMWAECTPTCMYTYELFCILCFCFLAYYFFVWILCSSEVPYQDELNITATTESIGVGLLRSEPVKGELIIFFRFQNIINKCPSSAVDNALALATRFWYCYRIDINVSINSWHIYL